MIVTGCAIVLFALFKSVRDTAMPLQLKNIAIAAAIVSTLAVVGCQKHEEQKAQDSAAATADSAAQAAQAATDAATAAVPAADAAADASAAASSAAATAAAPTEAAKTAS